MPYNRRVYEKRYTQIFGIGVIEGQAEVGKAQSKHKSAKYSHFTVIAAVQWTIVTGELVTIADTHLRHQVPMQSMQQSTRIIAAQVGFVHGIIPYCISQSIHTPTAFDYGLSWLSTRRSGLTPNPHAILQKTIERTQITKVIIP